MLMTMVDENWSYADAADLKSNDQIFIHPSFLILFPLISVPLVQLHQFPTQTSFSSSFPPPVIHPIFYPSRPRNFFLRSAPTSTHHQGRLFLIIRDCQLQAVKNERYLRIRRRKLNCDFSFLIVEQSASHPRENINLYSRFSFFFLQFASESFSVLAIENGDC